MTVSIATMRAVSLRSRWLRALGPAFAVSIGYVDPGNWATDLGAGAYGYRLLWVVIVANAVAIVLQLAVSKLTIATGKDFGALIASRWPRFVVPAWLVFQGAAIATDVAEFSGIVLGLQLLFGLSLIASVLSGLAIVAAILLLTVRNTKCLEYALLGALAVISLACLYQVPLLHPAWRAVVQGALVPGIPSGSLVIMTAIIGATVMPHNLFLHSALVRKDIAALGEEERRLRGRFFARETIVALNVAMVVNGAILVVAGALHGAGGSFQRAFSLLTPMGGALAVVFGGAFLLSGIAASITATISGDFIFNSLAPMRLSPALRRAATILPAAVLIIAGASITQLLIWSQVALALALPIALVPLVLLLRGQKLRIVPAAAASIFCVAFDVVMLVQTFQI